jgi:hypothetical protein
MPIRSPRRAHRTPSFRHSRVCRRACQRQRRGPPRATQLSSGGGQARPWAGRSVLLCARIAVVWHDSRRSGHRPSLWQRRLTVRRLIPSPPAPSVGSASRRVGAGSSPQRPCRSRWAPAKTYGHVTCRVAAPARRRPPSARSLRTVCQAATIAAHESRRASLPLSMQGGRDTRSRSRCCWQARLSRKSVPSGVVKTILGWARASSRVIASSRF